jgi:late competence protein required for DNA uptake (superfamily II DNA/RNA helicase)
VIGKKRNKVPIKEKMMAIENEPAKKKNGISCQRCNGRMAFEKFYGPSNCFFGMRCLLCGDILDPVILLHRLSRDASIPIPEHKNEIISLIRKYMPGAPKTRFA